MDDWSSGEERAWLESELAHADAEPGLKWRIAVVHHGPFSAGHHGGNPRLLRPHVPELLVAHHVDLLLCGHDHIYERGDALGLRYIVSGGGGAPLYTDITPLPSTRKAEAAYHTVLFAVTPDEVKLTATRLDGSQLDTCAFGHEPGWRCGPRDAPSAPASSDASTAAPSGVEPARKAASCGCSVAPRTPLGGWGALCALVGLGARMRKRRRTLLGEPHHRALAQVGPVDGSVVPCERERNLPARDGRRGAPRGGWTAPHDGKRRAHARVGRRPHRGPIRAGRIDEQPQGPALVEGEGRRSARVYGARHHGSVYVGGPRPEVGPIDPTSEDDQASWRLLGAGEHVGVLPVEVRFHHGPVDEEGRRAKIAPIDGRPVRGDSLVGIGLPGHDRRCAGHDSVVRLPDAPRHGSRIVLVAALGPVNGGVAEGETVCEVIRPGLVGRGCATAAAENGASEDLIVSAPIDVGAVRGHHAGPSLRGSKLHHASVERVRAV